jgi:hypothetical protein
MNTRFDFGSTVGSLIQGKRFAVCAVVAGVSPVQIEIPQPARLPLPVPRQRVQIDIAAGQNDSYAFSTHVDYPFENCSIRNSR